jgi:hypothetical protein
MIANVATDVVRDEKSFALIVNDDKKYREFMAQYHQIKNQKDAEKQQLENRFTELESKVEANSVLLNQIWAYFQTLNK